MGATGGGGAGGGEVHCADVTQCPATGSECMAPICVGGVCGTQAVASGTPTETQTPGDCQRAVCDGAGNTSIVNDDTDVPVDNNDCTQDLCTSGAPSNPPLAVGTPCGQGGSMECDQNGQCVGCLQPANCAGQDDECHWRTCTGGVCGTGYAVQGTPLAQQTPGDCRLAVCDGSGNTSQSPDNGDVPVDGNDCTADQCTNGQPSNPPFGSGTPCSQNGGAVCNGGGACVQCVAPGNCASVAHGSASCQNNVCVIGGCNPGWADCYNGYSDGCETNTTADPNCGQCFNDCNAPTPYCVNSACQACPPASGGLALAGPIPKYGFCWFLSQPGNTCDAVCASLGGSNLSNSAANAWPDSCGTPTAADVTMDFYNNGNPAGWTGPYSGSIGYHTLGMGYTSSIGWFSGKCSSGGASGCGTFPGDSCNMAERHLVCPCF